VDPSWGRIKVSESVQGGSDHRRFNDAGIPVLYFTTGKHRDHHQVTDTPDKIDFDGADYVADMVGRLIRTLPGPTL
jgi:hypothetical protein